MLAPLFFRRRLLPAIIAGSLVLTLALGLSATARADGDPASDVLSTQALFLPQDAGVPASQQLELAALVQEAARSGYPIRLALIASASDLGSITELFGQPVNYAKFLGQELSLTYRGLLVVLMPGGFGVYHQGHPTAREQAALTGIALRPTGSGLADAALAAVQRLSAAAGHPLSLARLHAATAPGGDQVVPWLVFVAGLALIVLAWTASLRARPLRQPRNA